MKQESKTYRVSANIEQKMILILAILVFYYVMIFRFRLYHLPLLAIYSVIFVILIDWLFKYYTFDQNGVQQHWFFHIDRYSWDDFKEIFLVQQGKKGTVSCSYSLCMDRGIPHRIELRIDQSLHWFRLIAIELQDENGKTGILKWSTDKDEFLRYLESIGILPEVKPYKGLLSDD